VNALYQNNAGKGFIDVTKAAGVGGAPMFSASCAFADVDRDGDVDLFVVNYVDARVDNNTFCGDVGRKYRIYCHPLTFQALRNTLYRNNGSGVFTDVSKETGILDHRGNGLGVVFGDYDDDGWVDGFVANDSTPNFLFHNDAGRRFTETALLAGVSGRERRHARGGWAPTSATTTGRRPRSVRQQSTSSRRTRSSAISAKALFEDATFPSGVGPGHAPLRRLRRGVRRLRHDADLGSRHRRMAM
jgi:hypothetical protein